jgi:hypothetical protein
MKKLLSLLMCFVFLQAETFAWRGGPQNGNSNKVLGYYSGFMFGDAGSGNTGLFLLAASGEGSSAGQVVIFSKSKTASDTYSCRLIGLSDASQGGSGKFVGVFSGAAITSSGSATKSLSGQLTCFALPSTGGNTSRITGTATTGTITISNSIAANGITVENDDGSLYSIGGVDGTFVGRQINYIIDGWQTASPTSGSAAFALSSN